MVGRGGEDVEDIGMSLGLGVIVNMVMKILCKWILGGIERCRV